MRTNILSQLKKSKNVVAKCIIALLLIANIAAFSIGTSHFKTTQKSSIEISNSEDFNVLKTGWQLMHWSYSILKFYKGSPAE